MKHGFQFALWFLLLGGRMLDAQNLAPGNPRRIIPLQQDWLFQRDGGNEWKTVQLPASFQSHEKTEFHGIGWYRKMIEPFAIPPSKRVLLQFQAAATEAQVWCDGQLLGTHLGGWTPFRFDITELLRAGDSHREHEIRVRLDEKVGHNTQGFLPVIAPHFGGLWQPVSLVLVPQTYLDDLRIMAIGDPATGELRLDVPVKGEVAAPVTNLLVRIRLHGQETWQDVSGPVERNEATLSCRQRVPDFRLWSPAAPNLYDVEIAVPEEGGDRVRLRAAFRSIRANGPEFLLNGKPLSIRGVLNWGYSAPLVSPNPGEAVWRSELEFARSHGFNLMKFCLWVPPQPYLELADELGMLTWMEYPTWHPNLTANFLEPLRREFNEFFDYDRNHPSLILRSLTCETGSSADLEVIRSLYNAAHQAIPHALVEDDSSWIGWNRINDFWDDHPYGNNHTWVKTLRGFNEFILGHGLKPMVLGETTAADTWIDRATLLAQLGNQRPWWAPRVLDDTESWLEKMRGLYGEGGLAELTPDSLRYGLLMRKFQIEAFRREVPYGGYVISVIRDFPGASMGLLDYQGQPKWSSADWAWQRETMCLLQTEADRRSFSSGEALSARILLSHFGTEPLSNAVLEVSLTIPDRPGEPLKQLRKIIARQNPGTLAEAAQLDWPLPNLDKPTHVFVNALLRAGGSEFRNEWPLWIVPRSRPDALHGVQVHTSVADALRTELFPGCAVFKSGTASKGSTASPDVVVASRFDEDLAAFLEQGGRVLFLPDGQQRSLPLSEHWFLKGAPYIPKHALSREIPRDLLLELQDFDLAGDIMTNFPCLDVMDPVLMLWDTHDDKVVKTHPLVFETRVANGRLFVTALRHDGQTNAAGHWLLDTFVQHLKDGPPPKHGLSAEVWAKLKAKLHEGQTGSASLFEGCL